MARMVSQKPYARPAIMIYPHRGSRSHMAIMTISSGSTLNSGLLSLLLVHPQVIFVEGTIRGNPAPSYREKLMELRLLF